MPTLARLGNIYVKKIMLGTVEAWKFICDIIYSAKLKSVTAQDIYVMNVRFNTDGTKMYYLGSYYGKVHQYTLSTAWDVSTATYVKSSNIKIPGTETQYCIWIKPDGTTLFASSGGILYEYSLPTIWDIGTITFVKSVTVSGMYGIEFTSDGSKLFTTVQWGSVREHTLSTSWDINSISTVVKSLSITYMLNSAFTNDGLIMFITQSNNGLVNYAKVLIYRLNVAWDISTAELISSQNVYQQDNNILGICLTENITKMYLSGNNTENIYQYELVW